uniref:Uncharacterized protein n=1 Tax=Panagrolaimus sp. ES5 TaxID=591445 RepID=A0AC34FKL2_9BILA
MYDHDVTDLKNHKPPIPLNETARFRESIFGGIKLFIIDGIIILWGSYISACALTVYLLANRAICRQYHAFNKVLKQHIDDGSITNYAVIKEFESQIIDFMSTACYITNTTAFLVDLTFMTGIFIQISAQFALRAFSITMEPIQNGIFGVWVAESIVLLVVATKRPATLQSLVSFF